MWIDIARENPNVEFWAYTKSLSYWIKRLKDIPSNLELTASEGGGQDELIKEHDLKRAIVFPGRDSVPDGMPIDTNDDCARDKKIKIFALIDNYAKK